MHIHKSNISRRTHVTFHESYILTNPITVIEYII